MLYSRAKSLVNLLSEWAGQCSGRFESNRPVLPPAGAQISLRKARSLSRSVRWMPWKFNRSALPHTYLWSRLLVALRAYNDLSDILAFRLVLLVVCTKKLFPLSSESNRNIFVRSHYYLNHLCAKSLTEFTIFWSVLFRIGVSMENWSWIYSVDVLYRSSLETAVRSIFLNTCIFKIRKSFNVFERYYKLLPYSKCRKCWSDFVKYSNTKGFRTSTLYCYLFLKLRTFCPNSKRFRCSGG